MEGRRADDIFETSPWITELVARLGTIEESSLRVEGVLNAANHDIEVIAEASKLHDRDGLNSGAVLTLHDVGQRYTLRSQEQERARLAELDSLVASLGHEINNPLSGVRGAAQLLSRKLEKSNDLAEYAQMIVRQADRVADLVSSLMALEAPKLTPVPTNIHRVLNEVILLEKPTADELGVAITHEFDPSLPELLADPDQLQQLFLNVLKNAIAACTEDVRRVTVATRMIHSYYVEEEAQRHYFIAVEIRDTGSGLDDEVLARMFSPLFSRTKSGHGLGLAIAQSIAAAHRGTIEAENAPSGGALLRVTLPVTRKAEAE